VVKLRFSSKFQFSGFQPPLLFLRGFRAAANQPADHFVPAGRGQEDEVGVGHSRLDLPRSLEVDLEEDGLALGDRSVDGAAKGAVAVLAVNYGPLQQFAVGYQGIELFG
jgi:hypothetical protein